MELVATLENGLRRVVGKAALVLLLALSSPLLSVASEGNVLSICDLTRDPMALNGATVRVKAIYATDRFEFSGLTDDRCPAVVISLYDAVDPPKKHRSVIAFDRAVAEEKMLGKMQLFEIEFSGTFRWDDSPGPRESFSGIKAPRGRIDLRRVWTYSKWRS
jgi:hypothetical protein